MLLCEITINSVVNYVSIDGIMPDGSTLTHNWRPLITGIDPPTIGIPANHGGYAQMQYGSISFAPELFASDWPPPLTCAIGLYNTDTTEAERETIFIGTAHLNPFDREAISYSLYGPSYDETIAAATAYNDHLNDVINSILTTIPEITTVNTAFARATSPNVTYTTSGVQLAIDLASNIAAFYSHLIYVVGTTAYLIDMKLNNGSRTLTEYQFFSAAQYSYLPPVSILTASVAGTPYEVASSYPYGTPATIEPYHTTEANIKTALTDILTIIHSPRTAIRAPLIAGNFPLLGEKLTLADTSNVADIAAWFRVRKMAFDFINDEIQLEGEGAISA